MIFPEQYHSPSFDDYVIIDERISDEKIETFYENGRKVTDYVNGMKKELWPDGYSIIFFSNKDIKQTFPAMKKTVYYFYE